MRRRIAAMVVGVSVASCVFLSSPLAATTATDPSAPPTHKPAQPPGKSAAPAKKPVHPVPKKKPPVRKRVPAKAALAHPAPPPPPPASPDPEAVQAQQREQAAQRDELLARLAALKRDIASSEASRSEAADALASSEQAISETNRKLHDLGTQESEAEARVAAIGAQRATTEKARTSKQTELARLLHDQYSAGPNDALRSLLSGDDPSRIERDLVYRDYVSQAQAALLVKLEADLAALADLAQQAQQQNELLAGIANDQKEQRGALEREQDVRRQTLAQVSEKLQAQRVEAGALERDEKRLSDIVDELGKLIERQARESRERERQRAALKEKQREEEARRAAQSPKEVSKEASKEGPGAKPTAPIEEALPPIAYAGNFATLRGRLRLPVKGDIAGHFGSARGGGGPTWKGVFIRADQGSEVHAIAPGRVVFAEWLRGFGNLLIIDHGEEYLSIYGNNESLLKQPGDSVQSGELVATVGNSGGIEQTGLYFEMRYQGKPFDPLAWAAPR